MQRKTHIIPRSPITRILMKAGAKRVAASAADSLADIAMEKAFEIAKKAVQIAHHSKRKTVLEGDVKLAAKD